VGKSGSLIAESTSPVPANIAIDKGVFWDGNCLTAVLYDRATCVRQCPNCQEWGHIGATCPNKPQCVHCAGEHLSRECSAKVNGTLKENKSANCGDPHAAWATDCPEREKEVARTQELAKYGPRYHPVPAYYSIHEPAPSPHLSTASSWKTPQEPSSAGGSNSAPATTAQSGTGGRATRSTTGVHALRSNAAGVGCLERMENCGPP
jgi:hypothetical protein